MANTAQTRITSATDETYQNTNSGSTQKSPSAPDVNGTTKPRAPSTPRGPSIHQIYAQPVPIRTFPLPSFYPHNPLSWLHVAYVWINQALFTPPEPSTVHRGVWSPKTRSVHVTDAVAIRALWEQGFFGKGAYSRSEPNWLRREQARLENSSRHVAELHTAKVREERRLMKWDRARKEQDAIRRTRIEEARIAPVGPSELLALPNSAQDLELLVSCTSVEDAELLENPEAMNGFSPLPNAINGKPRASSLSASKSNGPSSPDNSSGTPRTPHKRRKSVRFSPKVESATYGRSDPPSPRLNGQANGRLPERLMNGHSSPLFQSSETAVFEDHASETVYDVGEASPAVELVDREHLQLTSQEALYLSYGLGVLSVTEETAGDDAKAKSVEELVSLFRRNSYIPSMTESQLQPDDPFLVDYVAYHHFRSLGWVVRPGIKFGVDWLLYHRGPVFSHAEFAVALMPAYTDPWWKSQGRQPRGRTWHWLHTVNRVQAAAVKTVILVYVDIPPPTEEKLDLTSMLKRYSVREFMVKRWVSNRNRD